MQTRSQPAIRRESPSSQRAARAGELGETFGEISFYRRRSARTSGALSQLALDVRLRRSLSQRWPLFTSAEAFAALRGARRGYYRAAQRARQRRRELQ